MIHHISIPARDPRRVAGVLAELFKGRVYPFPPLEGAYMAVSGDTNGTMIEVYPEAIVLETGGNGDDEVIFADAAKAGITSAQSTAFHAFVSVPLERDEIERIGAREGWRAKYLGRGVPGQPPLFYVIEFWVEDKFMLELATPSMVPPYANTVQFEALDRFFQ